MHRKLSPIWMAAVCAAFSVFTSSAATRVKANNETNLNVGASWVGGAVPGVNDVAVWSNTVTAANAVLLGGDMSVQGVVIGNPGGEVALGGSHALTLGFRGIIMNAAAYDFTLTNQTLNLLDYTCPVWNIAAGRTATVKPASLVLGSLATLGVQGAGTVSCSALANDETGIIGPWARYGTGTAAKYATVSGETLTGYTGLHAATAAGVTDTTGSLNYDVAAAGALGAGASFNTLRYTGTVGTVSGAYTANGLLNAGAGTLTMSGTTVIGTNRVLVLTTPDTTRRIDLTGVVSDNPNGASGLTVTGGGQVRLTSDNTFSGVSAVSAGSLYASKPNALGSTNGHTVIYVSGSSVSGGQLQLGGSTTLVEPLLFIGSGDGDPWHSAMAVAWGGGTNTVTGPITITAAGVRFTAAGNGTALNLNGPVTRTSPGNTLILGAGGSNGVLNVNYPINNNGGNVNLHNGAGTVRFNVTGSNLGDINVQYQHVLQLGVSDALTVTRGITVGNVNTQGGTPSQGTFDLAGFSQSVNFLSGDGVFGTAPPSTRTVTNTAASLSTLTVGASGGSGTFNGVFAGNLALVKTGGGTEILCGPNIYTGGTTVNGGTLVVSNAQNHGALAVNGGTFRFPPSLTVNGSLSGSGGTIDTLDASSVLTVNQATNAAFAGVLSGAGSLVKNGAGTLTLAGANTFSGGTTVNEGLVCFGRTSSKPASGSVTVAAGAGLGLGVGGSGFFSAADVDALWSGAMAGVALDAASLIGIDTAAGDFTYASSQSTRGLVKTGTNTLTLTGVNTYVGGTFVQAGVLAVPTAGSLPGWDAGGSYWVSRDAGLALGNAFSDADFVTVTGTGNFADGGCAGFDTTAGNRTYAGSVGNTVNGALGVVKVGTNTLTLTGDSTYDGNTFLNGGKLVIKHSNALGSTNGYTVVNRAGGTSPLFTDSTGQLLLDGSGGALTLGESFVLIGDQQYGYGGAMRSTAGNNVINGWIALGPSGRIGLDNGSLTLNGRIVRAQPSTNPMLVLSPNAGSILLSNTVDIGTGLVNFHSGGLCVIGSSSNTWGSSQIQYGGNVRLGADEAMAIGKRVAFGNNEPGNGRLDLYGYSQTIGGLTEYGNAASRPNNIITNGRPESLSTLTVSQTAGTSDYFSGRLMGALSLVKAGAANSVLTLAGANAFTGDTGLAGGALVLSNQLALQNSTLNVTNAGGAVRFGSGLVAFTLGGLAGSVGFGLTNAQGAAVTVSVGNNGASTVYSGSLSGAGGLTKVGGGTLTLTGENVYSGATTVAGGTLALGSVSALGMDSVIVLAGGALQAGPAGATLGQLQVTADSTLALGDGAGTISFADSTGQTWGGLLNVTGTWTPTSLRVGTGSGGLTAAQIHSFSYNGERVWVQIDENGYLWKMTGSLMWLK